MNPPTDEELLRRMGYSPDEYEIEWVRVNPPAGVVGYISVPKKKVPVSDDDVQPLIVETPK